MLLERIPFLRHRVQPTLDVLRIGPNSTQAQVGSPERADMEQRLRDHLGAMQQRWTQQIGDPAVPEVARQALALMDTQANLRGTPCLD